MWKSLMFHMRIGVVACGSHLTRMWSYRLSHAVSPLFHMCYSAFSHVLCMRITCNFIACHMWKPNVSHVIHTEFTCESHAIWQHITCGVHGYFVCNTHVNRMCFTCENTCFHMWTVIFVYFHMWNPLFITCVSHVIHMRNILNYMWQISPLHMWTLGFHMWSRFFHM